MDLAGPFFHISNKNVYKSRDANMIEDAGSALNE